MLYDKVKEVCKEKGVSVSAVERHLEFGNGTITKWNDVSPNVCNLKKVADYLGKPIEYFLK